MNCPKCNAEVENQEEHNAEAHPEGGEQPTGDANEGGENQ